MLRISLVLLLIAMISCNEKTTETEVEITNDVDPHTLSNASQAVVKHLDLDLTVNFESQQLKGKATWVVDNLLDAENVIFDTKDLTIEKVTIGKDNKQVKFTLGEPDVILGQALTVPVDTGNNIVTIYYTTSKTAGALQWLTPQQTAGKKLPYLFTQSEPILARTWIPCQDGPGIRFTYNATIHVPKELMAVMSAENPQKKDSTGIYTFQQIHPIPSYLLALAVGDIAFKPIDNRTGVYAEPSVLDKAAWEFSDMGKMVTAAEALYGPYAWGRYDVLVLPPSFPYGGMENPNLTFATPTVIAGDKSLVSLIAHELAHSWSGNLVTNASWNDMWLNEGFTTYFERRIVEALYGKEEAQMQEVLGRQSLQQSLNELGATSVDTKLKLDLKGKDPDQGISDIAYEKGYAFLKTIEGVAGREKFDSFLKGWFSTNAFQSKETEDFLNYMGQHLAPTIPSFEEKLMSRTWVYNPGIPSNIAPVTSSRFNNIDSIVRDWKNNKKTTTLANKIKSTNERLYFLSKLPDSMSKAEMTDIDQQFHFTSSGNTELQCAWYTKAIKNDYAPARPAIEKFLTNVGRRKFLVPLYKEMVKTESGKEWAKKIYNKARANYHPVSYKTIDEILKLG